MRGRTLMLAGLLGIIKAIRQAKPDVILNFLSGDINLAFHPAYRRAEFSPDRIPTIGFSIDEDESRRFAIADIVGHYAAWDCFQSIGRLVDREFVRKFRLRFGDGRMVGDAMIAVYNSIHSWAKAANEVGSANPTAVRANLICPNRDAPNGIVSFDPATNIVWRPFHVTRVQPDGQFGVIYSLMKPIRPVIFGATRSACGWTSWLANLKTRWQGRRAAAAGTAPEASGVVPVSAR